jgi:hypothetical protein
VNQLPDRRSVKSKARGRDVRQIARAGGVVGIEELAPAADRILFAGQKMLLVLGCQKRRQMVVKPPGNPRRRRIFEIDNGVFVAGKLVLVKQSPRPMHQAVVLVAGACRDPFAVKPREQRGRARSVKEFVVIKDANLQVSNSSLNTKPLNYRNC